MKIKLRNKFSFLGFSFILFIAFYIVFAAFQTSNSVELSVFRKWEMVDNKIPFVGRSGHTCDLFNGNLLLIGGWDGYKAHNDIWTSKDGTNWKLLRKHTPFCPRAVHSTVIYKNKIWLIGGLTFSKSANIIDLNDIWNSSDGIHWKKVSSRAPFQPRGAHRSVVFKNRIWVIGGINKHADIWSSNNGINWKQEVKNAPFESRGAHACLVFNDKIWVIGGMHVNKENNYVGLSDVWCSEDGLQWNKVAENSDIFGGGGHTAVVFKKRMVVIGGFRKRGAIFTSKNGLDWIEIDVGSDFGERILHTSSIFKDKIWIIGGHDGAGFKNDIWFLKENEMLQSQL